MFVYFFRYALTSDKPVLNKKYNLLSWSPGQYDMPTFKYSESLTYEVEKDYLNNYSDIPLGGDPNAGAESDALKAEKVTERFPIFKSFTRKVSD
jgi:hypothetical protein